MLIQLNDFAPIATNQLKPINTPDKHAITSTDAIPNKDVSPMMFNLGEDAVPAGGPVTNRCFYTHRRYFR